MMQKTGVVAAGHKETAKAAEVILHDGGNAFDAVVCRSSGGLCRRTGREAEETDFLPISADFGTAQQEFHIGGGVVLPSWFRDFL